MADRELIDGRYMTEQTSATLKLGTLQRIECYVDSFPGIWNNKSHFIRSAIEAYIEAQRNKGRHINITG